MLQTVLYWLKDIIMTIDSDEYCSFTKEVKESIDKIYKTIFDRYTGKFFC